MCDELQHHHKQQLEQRVQHGSSLWLKPLAQGSRNWVFRVVMSEEVPAEIPVAEVGQVEKKKKKKRRAPKESQSVFESQPAASSADVGANKEFEGTDQEPVNIRESAQRFPC